MKLPTDVAAKFKLVNWQGGKKQNFGKFGIVDLETITIQTATRLHNKGFSKLELKDNTPAITSAKKK